MTWLTVVALIVSSPKQGVPPNRVALFGVEAKQGVSRMDADAMAKYRKSALHDCELVAADYRLTGFTADCKVIK